MSLRARMHPRNIYKTPPNFKQLAIDYPEFRKYVKTELSGRVTLDYNNRYAIIELTRLLLLKDFNLMVDIDESRLIPRVPVCLNYILWIEDLLCALNKEEIQGIDIGTGSVCIYSLLAATKGWKMLATEIDKSNFDNASENVKRNKLNDKITVKFVEDPNRILDGVIDDGLEYDFCMCNPPFYDKNEKPVNRTRKRKMLDIAASYVETDVSTKGGELSFVKKLIDESKQLGDKVKIYTTLIGKKADFNELKKHIVNVKPAVMTDTEFCQGNTIRWGIAWSFLNLNFTDGANKINPPKKQKTKIMQFVVPEADYSLNDASEKVQKILDCLKIMYNKQEINGDIVFTLKAYENTWSHQRRKNRLKKREEKESVAEEPVEDNDETTPAKKPKSSDNLDRTETASCDKPVLVESLLSLKQEDDDEIALDMSWLSGSKEGVHQIFQYIKNNWIKLTGSDEIENT